MHPLLNDYIGGNTGYVGLEPGVLYHMSSIESAQLLDISEGAALTKNGISCAVQDNAIILSGTCTTDNTIFSIFSRLSLPAGTYFFTSQKLSGGGNGDAYLQIQPNLISGNLNNIQRAFDAPEGINAGPYIRINEGAAFVDDTFRVMLNAGNAPKPWEPFCKKKGRKHL